MYQTHYEYINKNLQHLEALWLLVVQHEVVYKHPLTPALHITSPFQRVGVLLSVFSLVGLKRLFHLLLIHLLFYHWNKTNKN